MAPTTIGLSEGPRRMPLAKRTPTHQRTERRTMDTADLSFLDAASFTNASLEPLALKSDSQTMGLMPSDISEADISMILVPTQEPLAEGALREQERALDASKREIFALKLKIYHLEERLKGTFSNVVPDNTQREEELAAARDAALAALQAERQRFAAERQEQQTREEAQHMQAAQALREAEHRRFLLEAELEDALSRQQSLAALGLQHESISAQHSTLVKKHSTLVDEYSVLEKKHSDLSELHMKIEETNRRLVEEHSRLTAHHKKVCGDGEKLAETLTGLEEELRRLQDERSMFQNECVLLQQQLQQNAEKSDAAHQNTLQTETLKSQFLKENEALHAQLRELQSEYGKMQTRCAEFQVRVGDMEGEHHRLSAERTVFLKDIEAERTRIERELREERAQVDQRLYEERVKVREAEQALDGERKKRMSIECAFAESRAALAAAENLSAVERERLSKGLSAGRAALTASFEHERDRIIAEAERRCVAAERQLAEATRALGESARALADRERWREEAAQAARAAEARAAALAADLQRLQAERCDGGAESLQRSYVALQSSYESLQKSSQSLQANMESMRRSYESLERSHDGAQRRLQELHRTQESMAQENALLSRRLEEIEGEKSRIQTGFSSQLSRSMEKTRDCELELLRQRTTIEDLERQLGLERERFQTELSVLRNTAEPTKDIVAAIADGLVDRLRLTTTIAHEAETAERQVAAEAKACELSLAVERLRVKVERRTALLRKAVLRIESLGRKRDALRQQLTKARGAPHTRSFVALAQRALHRRHPE